MMSLIKQNLQEEGEGADLLSEKQMILILMIQKMQIYYIKMDKKREMTIVIMKTSLRQNKILTSSFTRIKLKVMKLII
jgi:hypothetical protein